MYYYIYHIYLCVHTCAGYRGMTTYDYVVDKHRLARVKLTAINNASKSIDGTPNVPNVPIVPKEGNEGTQDSASSSVVGY